MKRGFFLAFLQVILFVKTFAAVVLSEINFNPTCSNDDCEYVEIFNSGPTSVDISGWSISDGEAGINEWGRVFPTTTIIAAGAFIIVTKNLTAFNNAYSFSGQLFQIVNSGTGAGLANSGDDVTLRDNGNNVIASHTYPGSATSALAFNGIGWVNGQSETPGSNSLLLPIELTSFQIKNLQKGAELTWITATETNNSHFEIEHSADGLDFETIGRVTGAGSSISQQRYRFLHENPRSGLNYYRLRQVDFDGAFEYSEIKSIRYNNRGNLRLQPNIADNFTEIHFSEEIEEMAILEVFDLIGQKIWVENLERGAFYHQLDVSHLQRGGYFIRLKLGKEIFTGQFQKM